MASADGRQPSADNRQGSKASRSGSKDPNRRKRGKRSASKGEDGAADKKVEQRRAGFDRWKETNFRVGAHTGSAADTYAENPLEQSDMPLSKWFGASMKNFIGHGSLFAATALPHEYQALQDDHNVAWIKHRRTDVLMWPVRIDLGAVSDPCDALTIYYYCSPDSMLNFTTLISTGSDALTLFDALTQDAVGARPCDANDPREREGAGFSATVCEPAKYATRADVLFDRIGQQAWPPSPENKKDASRCLAFSVPVHSIALETAARPDRVLVFGLRLRPMIQASVAWQAKPAYFRRIGFEELVSTVQELPDSTWEIADLEAKIRKGRKRTGLMSCLFTEGGGGRAKDIWEVDVPLQHLARIRCVANEAARRDNRSLKLVDGCAG